MLPTLSCFTGLFFSKSRQLGRVLHILFPKHMTSTRKFFSTKFLYFGWESKTEMITWKYNVLTLGVRKLNSYIEAYKLHDVITGKYDSHFGSGGLQRWRNVKATERSQQCLIRPCVVIDFNTVETTRRMVLHTKRLKLQLDEVVFLWQFFRNLDCPLTIGSCRIFIREVRGMKWTLFTKCLRVTFEDRIRCVTCVTCDWNNKNSSREPG